MSHYNFHKVSNESRGWQLWIRRLFQFSLFFRISNYFDLSITEETWVVEIRIWCIKIVNVLVLHFETITFYSSENNWRKHKHKHTHVE
jgi:hypothetical protein